MKRKLAFLLSFALLLSCFGFIPSISSAADKAELFMNVGSPIALSEGNIVPLDKENPDLVPIIHKNRTLIPLRMISEHFGAQVSYDEKHRSAVIKTAKGTALFPIGKNHYTYGDKQIDIDTETLIVSGRAFVPLRTICEEILGLSVDYRDRVIYIADTAKLTDDLVKETRSRIGMYIKVSSLDALKSYQTDSINKGGSSRPATDMFLMENSTSSESPAPQDAAYSSTNVQVEGIDEGDIVKTDGKYIYAISNQSVKIVEANQGSMAVAGEFFLGKNAYAQELYIDKNRVIIIGSRGDGGYHIMDSDSTVKTSMIMPPRGTSYTFIQILDTSDLDQIKSMRYFEIEGNLAASRKNDGYLYLLSSYSNWYYNGNDPRPLLEKNGQMLPMPVDDIMIMPTCPGNQYLTLSAIDIMNADIEPESETITGSGYVSYMSDNALYIAMTDYLFTTQQSVNIARFSIDGAKIGYAGSCRVEGTINDQFSFDESKGYLRVATTVNWPESYNNLFVLNSNMDVCGSVTGFAEDERIYSARFIGDRGYIVTFRQMDPLFVFDLSDPTDPKITGELKVPGFSTYLHPISEDVILGVGQDVHDLYKKDSSGNEVVVGQQTGGLKVSLFDVSDLGKPQEIDHLILGDYGYSELLYNHKAAMFKKDDGLLGFCAEITDNREKSPSFKGAFLISYAGNQLKELGRLKYENPYGANGWGNDTFYGQRLVYIGDTLYYLQDGLLRSFDLYTHQQQFSLKLF